MGAKDNPVHIFHWRAQYQRDAERGKPKMKDLYPNSVVDMYPMEFADPAATKHITDADRERFSPGRAEGNPQAYAKSGVDEILAEGFSTSSVQQTHGSVGRAVWQDGEWTLVISRPLDIKGGSVLQVGGKSFVAFAVWQGGEGEVGSRKCVTMMWTPLTVASLVAEGGR
jgi:DMSO reductase family type II enzyme heme b subunit